jgi:hypothetical protein
MNAQQTATRTRNEYRPIAERQAPADLTLAQLVTEFASLRVDSALDAVHYGTRSARHARLDAVVTELRRWGALD